MQVVYVVCIRVGFVLEAVAYAIACIRPGHARSPCSASRAIAPVLYPVSGVLQDPLGVERRFSPGSSCGHPSSKRLCMLKHRL